MRPTCRRSNGAHGPLATNSRQTVAISLALGAAVGVATFTGGVAIADAILLIVCVLVHKRPPGWVWVIATPIALSAPWASHWWLPVWTAARILALGVAFGARPRAPMVVLGYCAMLFPQTIGLLTVIGHSRPSGLTDNASVLGQVGLAALTVAPVAGIGMLPALITGAVSTGLAAARVPLLALAVLTVVKPGRVALAGFILTGLMLVAATTATHNWQRWGLYSSTEAVLDRVEDVPGTGVVTAQPPREEYLQAKAVEIARVEAGAGPKVDVSATAEDYQAARIRYPYHAPRLSVFGYGYGSFLDRTGTQRPHTIPVLAAYELGILALPLAGLIGWALWTRRGLPVWFALAMVPLWLFTDEQWATPAGHYMLALMLLSAIRSPVQNHQHRQAPRDDIGYEGPGAPHP